MNQWKYVKLGEVCTVERGGSPRPIDDFITTDENGINWIKIGDADESMYITKTAQRIKPEGMKKSRYVKPGDFLLSNSMSFGRPYILKIDGCIHDGWLVLRDENNVFDKKFLYYYLSAPITYKKFKSMAVGGVVNNLNSDMVRKVRVPIPSQEEQHRISDRLDKVSNVIFLRNQQLAKLDELVKARFVEMFGDFEFNPKEFPVYHLCELCDVGSSKRIYQEEQSISGIPFLKVADLNELIDTGKYSCSTFIPLERYEQLLHKELTPTENDILITSRGTLGKCYIVQSDDEFYFQDGMISWLSNFSPKVSSIYISYLFAQPYIQKQIESLQAGSTVAYLSIAMLKKMNVILPPKKLQDDFATFVEHVDQQKQTVQQSLEKLELMKKALMQEYFG